MRRADDARGLRLIVWYKAVKALGEVGLAAVGVVLLALGLGERLHGALLELREHVVAAWSSRAVDLAVRETSPVRLWLATAAAFVDGLWTSFEGWALHRRYRWGPYLVVAATSALIPFEVYELSRRLVVSRALFLAINLAIVVYLARRARGEAQRATKGTRTSSGAAPSRSLRATSRSSSRRAE